MTYEGTPASRTRPLTLPGGARIPLLGFGTWQITGDDAVRATASALESGYRHLDTATIYGNEARGRPGARRERRGPRRGVRDDQVPAGQRRQRARHPPVRAWTCCSSTTSTSGSSTGRGSGSANTDLWRAFVEARDAGLTKEIGVSNFDASLLDEVTRSDRCRAGDQPDQVEPAALRRRRAGGAPCSRRRAGGLQRPPRRNPRAPRDRTRSPSVLGRTPAQVIIRWHLQHEVDRHPEVGPTPTASAPTPTSAGSPSATRTWRPSTGSAAADRHLAAGASGGLRQGEHVVDGCLHLVVWRRRRSRATPCTSVKPPIPHCPATSPHDRLVDCRRCVTHTRPSGLKH